MANYLEEQALNAVNFDPLETAQKLTGKEYDKDSTTSALGYGLLRANEEKKRLIFKELGDTYHRITWEKSLKIFENLNFEQISQIQEFKELSWGEVYEVKTNIYAHKTKPILMVTQPYNSAVSEPTLDKCDIYGKVDYRGKLENYGDQLNFGISTCPVDDLTWNISFDAREGLATKLQSFEESDFAFINWGGDLDVVFLPPYHPIRDYRENKNSRLRNINRLIEASPDYVRNFIMNKSEIKAPWILELKDK